MTLFDRYPCPPGCTCRGRRVTDGHKPHPTPSSALRRALVVLAQQNDYWSVASVFGVTVVELLAWRDELETAA